MYVSNVPISLPEPIPGAIQDVDMNGMSWSNKYGIFYHVSEAALVSIKEPVTKD